MKAKLVVFCILLMNAAQAQITGVSVKFSPLAAADFVSFPAVQAGIEIGISKKLSWYHEFGLQFGKGFGANADTVFLPTSGWKVKTELRYYFLPNDKAAAVQPLEGYYFAANLFAIRDVHNASSSYFLQRDTAQRKTDDFGVTKWVRGFNLLIGNQLSLGKSLQLDSYAGLGIRYRSIETISKEFDQNRDGLIEPVDVTIEGIRNHAEAFAGETLLPNLTLGFRLCYKFQ